MKQGLKPAVYINLILVYVIWSTTYLAIHYAMQTIEPVIMTGSRFLVAGFLMTAFMIIFRKARPTKRQVLNSLLAGSLLVGATGCVAIAMKTVGSGLAAVAIAGVTLWAAILGGFFGKKTRTIEWIGVIIGFSGIFILNFESDFRGNFTGSFMLMLAAPLWAMGSFLSHRLDIPDGMTGNGLSVMLGGIVVTLIGIALGERFTPDISVLSALSAGYLIIFGTIIAFTSYMYLFKHTRPALATSYSFVNPIGAVLIGVFFNSEIINVHGITALILVVIGVIFVANGTDK